MEREAIFQYSDTPKGIGFHYISSESRGHLGLKGVLSIQGDSPTWVMAHSNGHNEIHEYVQDVDQSTIRPSYVIDGMSYRCIGHYMDSHGNDRENTVLLDYSCSEMPTDTAKAITKVREFSCALASSANNFAETIGCGKSATKVEIRIMFGRYGDDCVESFVLESESSPSENSNPEH